MMVLDRRERVIREDKFSKISRFFSPGDVLVLNDTRVVPARLLGNKETGGKIEILLVRRHEGEEEEWICMAGSSKPLRPGMRLVFGEDLEGTVLAGGDPPFRVVRFHFKSEFTELLNRLGRIPLPPYIRREDGPLDSERYQTVFAANPGAVAAPTAGLHFTDEILNALRRGGVEIRFLTLHVGLGTFLPVRTENIREHRMHGESFCISEETAEAVSLAKREGRRVTAVGTTVTRALEHASDEEGNVRAGEGLTELFITPGFRFRAIDGMMTNFHLPKSTLLMLVSAFGGREFILEAYRRAVEEKFRFFSYGDCMLIQ